MKSREEKGQVIVILALVLVGLVGFTALAVDGGRIFFERRAAQSAADTASLAGALAKCQGGDVQAAALDSAAHNGFDNDGVSNSITVNNPPASGAYAGDADYVEVQITSDVPGAFYQLFYPETIHTTVRAISVCDSDNDAWMVASSNAIIALHPTAKNTLSGVGNGNINVTGGGIFVNSSNSKAAVLTGNGSVSADLIQVVGNYATTGHGKFTPTPTTGVTAITDPLAGLQPPPKPSGSCTTIQLTGNNDATLDPGLYCSIKATGNGDLTLNPGIYWIEKGEFAATGNGDVVLDKAMIYMGPGAGKFSLTGNGNLSVTPPNSGDYKGLALFVDRSNTNDVALHGNGSSTSVGGTFYAPSAAITLTGNGTSTTMDAQIISKTLVLTGNGNLILNFKTGSVYQPPFKYLISLVE